MADHNVQLAALRFSVRHPLIVIGTIAAATVLACLFIPRVSLKLDAKSLIPHRNKAMAKNNSASTLFGLRDVVVIGVTNNGPDGVLNVSTLDRIKRLTEALTVSDGIAPESVISIVNAPMLSEGPKASAIAPFLSSLEPLGNHLQRIKADVESLGLNDGVLLSPDLSAATIYGEVDLEADRYKVLEHVRELVTSESQGSDNIHLSGTALAQAVLGESAALDLVRLVPAVIVVLAIVLILAFRHFAPALISLVEIGTSLILTVGLMGLTGQSIFVTTLVMPVILVAVGVSDDVYALRHYFNEVRRVDRVTPEIVVEAFSKILRPIMLTAMSTMVGLLSLAVTRLEPLRVFGIFGALAILFSTLFTFTLVPALTVVMKPRPTALRHKQSRAKTPVHRLLSGLMEIGPRRGIVIAVFAAVCALWLTLGLRVDDSWIKNLPASSDIVQGDRVLNDRMAGTTTVELMVDGGRQNSFRAPENLAALGRIEEAVAQIPFVGAVQSLYSDVLRINSRLAKVPYSEFRKKSIEQGAGPTREQLDRAYSLMSGAKGIPLVYRVADRYRFARITVFIRSANYAKIDAVLEAVSAASSILSESRLSITPFGDGWISYLTVQLLVEGQIYSIALALAIDLVLLSILLGSIRIGLIAILPVSFSLILVFGLLGATGTPLGIANSMFTAIAIGIGLDFSIHLTAYYRQGVGDGLPAATSLRRALVNTGPAIVTSALAIAAGFSVLLASKVTPNVQLGVMICVSLIVCAAATLVIVPGLVLIERRGTLSKTSRRT